MTRRQSNLPNGGAEDSRSPTDSEGIAELLLLSIARLLHKLAAVPAYSRAQIYRKMLFQNNFQITFALLQH